MFPPLKLLLNKLKILLNKLLSSITNSYKELLQKTFIFSLLTINPYNNLEQHFDLELNPY